MKTGYRTDGPGGGMPPRPGGPTHPFANDNAVPAFRVARGIRGIALGVERAADGNVLAVIRAIDQSGLAAEPLLMTPEPFDVIALWRGLGRLFDLPLFLCDRTGQFHAIAARPGWFAGPRRRGSALSGRRPRFLTRRRTPPRRAVLLPGSARS